MMKRRICRAIASVNRELAMLERIAVIERSRGRGISVQMAERCMRLVRTRRLLFSRLR